MRLGKLLHSRKDGRLKVQLRRVCGIDVDANPGNGGLHGLLGAAVKHFAADAGRIRVPCQQDQLGGWASVLGGEVQIDETVTSLIFGEFRRKVLVGLVPFAGFFDLDGLLVLDLVDVVPELVAFRLQFELLEGFGHFVIGDDSCGLLLLLRVCCAFVDWLVGLCIGINSG